jgi:hypothetical protein
MTAPFFLRQQGVRASRQDPHDSTIAAARELTHVDVLWISQRVENRVRFGRIEQQHVIDRHWRVVSFAPDSIFAFLRWASNAYGTAYSQIDILRAVAPGEGYITVRTCTQRRQSAAHFWLAEGRESAPGDRGRRSAGHRSRRRRARLLAACSQPLVRR